MQIGFFDRCISQVIERHITNLFTRGALALTCKAGYALYYHPWISKQLNALTGKVIDLDVMKDVLCVYYHKVYKRHVECIHLDPIDRYYFSRNRFYENGVGRIRCISAEPPGRDELEDFTFNLSMWIHSIASLAGGSIPNYLYRFITRWRITPYDDCDSYLRRKKLSKYPKGKWIGGKLIP